jgi:hypothetical protein
VGDNRRTPVSKLGRTASLKEVRMVETAEGEKGGVMVRSDSLVVCARRVTALTARSGSGEGEFSGGAAPSRLIELTEARNWSRRPEIVVRAHLSCASAVSDIVFVPDQAGFSSMEARWQQSDEAR